MPFDRPPPPGPPPSDATYRRDRDLPRLIPLWPHEVNAEGIDGRLRLIAKLRQALREERRRGLAGHWAYDLARHAGLARAYRWEVSALHRETGTRATPGPGGRQTVRAVRRARRHAM